MKSRLVSNAASAGRLASKTGCIKSQFPGPCAKPASRLDPQAPNVLRRPACAKGVCEIDLRDPRNVSAGSAVGSGVASVITARGATTTRGTLRDVGSSKCAVPARLSRAALRALDDAAAGGGHSRVGSVVTPKILRRPVGCVEHADVPSPASVTRGLKRGAPEEDFPVTSAWRHNAVRDQRRKKSKPGPSRGRLQSIERDLPIYGAVPVAHTDRSAVVLQHQSERAARIRLLARSLAHLASQSRTCET